MTAWRSSVPRDLCQPVGAAGAIAQAQEVLAPRWSEGDQHISIEEWISEMARRFLAHRRLADLAPSRAETREALTELAKQAEKLMWLLQRMDAIALAVIEQEQRDWSVAAAHPLGEEEGKGPYQVLLLGNPCKGADSAFAGALQVLAFSARRATRRVPETKDGHRNSFTSMYGTAQGQLVVRCARTLQDLGLSIAGTIPKTSSRDSGALLFRLAHSVLWFATGEQEAEHPSERDLREAAKLFEEIATLQHKVEHAPYPDDWMLAMQELRVKEALLAKL